MRTFCLLVAFMAVAPGCVRLSEVLPPEPKATEELFIAIRKGPPVEFGMGLLDAFNNYASVAPEGTPITFFDGENQALLATMVVPKGSAAYRRKKIEQSLDKVLKYLDPEATGGPQEVDLLSIPATVRKYRKRSDLVPRVIVVGSPLVEDKEQGLSFSKEHVPCCGCVDDPNTTWGAMESFPRGTTTQWCTPRADFGNGPNHRSQVTEVLRYTLAKKSGPLHRMSSDPEVVFSGGECQWDEEAQASDNCNGLKKVLKDEAAPAVFDKEGNAQVISLRGERKVQARAPGPQDPESRSPRTLFLVDSSGSMAGGPLKSAQENVRLMIEQGNFSELAVCGFGGNATHDPVLSKFPRSLVSGLYWLEATPENRALGAGFVQHLQASGGTPTLAALTEAESLEGPMCVYLYSDGIPTLGTGGQQAVVKLAREMGKKGIVIHTVGVGALSVQNENFDFSGADFLAEVAAASGGKCYSLK